ncbi:MAG: hypothetical protein ACOX2P_07495 [Bacillota bacterium]
MAPELVNSLEEIMENIQTIDAYLSDPDPRLRSYAEDLIRRGTYYLAINRGREMRFYPSRFIGYKHNSRSAHSQNRSKDVLVTNKRISEIVGQELEKSATLEKEFKEFCKRLGFKPTRTGAYGVPRKYWNFQDLD